MKVLTILMGALLATVAIANGQPKVAGDTATILGVLLEADSGKPVEGLELLLLKAERKNPDGTTDFELWVMEGGRLPFVKTDEKGRFEFTRIPPGKYVLKAGDPAARHHGYLSLGKVVSSENPVELHLRAGDVMDLGVVKISRK